MKISKIEFSNFRNFKDHGEINFSTDGKVSIIYGENGDGKTTLHQLFKWIFYDKVSFNKTATGKLYNLTYEKSLPYNSDFEVMGRVEFEHAGEEYSLTRKYVYKKGIDDSELKERKVSLIKKDDNNNWKPLDEPEKIINKLLPEELSEYFFFDGESMIADLKLKEKQSAKNLRKALYSMFDLDILENAISHIGNINKKTSVLGKLYLQKGQGVEIEQIKRMTRDIDIRRVGYEKLKENNNELKLERKQLNESIKEISEIIGGKKSKAEYEADRKKKVKDRDLFLSNAKAAVKDFGDKITEMFPKLLIAKSAKEAEAKINLEISHNPLPKGLNRELIEYLTSGKTDKCICGHELKSSELESIEAYLELLPPKSYANLYNNFVNTYEMWESAYERDKLEEYISRVIDNETNALECENDISRLDEAQKESGNIEDLIIKRQMNEQRIDEINQKVEENDKQIKLHELALKKLQKEYEKATENLEGNKAAERKMNIIKEVVEHFENEINKASKEYSELLEINIQNLLDKMLTSKREAKVTTEFSVKVMDDVGDESKSEGQFAVVSFAYIGGILSMLHSKSNLDSKEYPLVLDGPFSKLDAIQRENVVNTLPEFAPQVIIFSKDDLQNIFPSEYIGKVWTIQSNEAKNIAKVEEGFLWK